MKLITNLLPTPCQKLPNVLVRMHSLVVESWLLCGENGKTVSMFEVPVLSIPSLVAKETNAPDARYTTHRESFFFLTVSAQLIFLSTLCSSHQTITLNALFCTLSGKLRIVTFSANLMKRLDSLFSHRIILSFHCFL